MAKTLDMNDIIAEPVDVEELISTLDFTDEDVLSAAKAQPLLYVHAVRFRIQQMRKRTKAESALSVLRSVKALALRQKGAAAGDRVTEGSIKERLDCDKEVLKASKQFNDAEQWEEYSKLLLEAFRMRRDALKVVADLIGAEVYVQRRVDDSPSELQKAKRRLQDKYPGKKHKET